MPLTFRQVRYFIATADAGKVSRAAAEMNVSQSTVTTAIKELERDLGTPLFERRSNGLDLTYEGHRFLQHAHQIVAAVAEAQRMTKSVSTETEGRIEVAVTYTVAGYFLPRALARFQRAFPNVEVVMREIDRPSMERSLMSGRIDLAVMLVSNLEHHESIASETLVYSRRRLWASPDHPLMHKEQATLADVAAEPYIMLTVDEADQTAMRYWRPTPYRPNVKFATSSVEAVRSMVAAGMGVTILSDMVFRPWSLEGQRIDARILVDPVPSMDVGLAWRRGREHAPAAAAFREFLRQGFASSRGVF